METKKKDRDRGVAGGATIGVVSPLAWRRTGAGRRRPSALRVGPATRSMAPTLESTQGQIDGFFSQFPYKCYQNRAAYVGD